MIKIVLGVVTALLLAACADLGSTSPAPSNPMATGAGHAGAGYPGPKLN
jgi:hypothetical protein